MPDLTERFEMRFSKELLDAVEEWRRRQPVIPPRAQAIRQLIKIALEVEDGK